jgi:hypothetical protein
MINLGKLFLPTTLDYLDSTQKLTLVTPELHSDDNVENYECTLNLSFCKSRVIIDYYSEDDVFLSELLDLDEGIVSGDLDEEDFGAIQERALKVLSQHIEDSQRELLDFFESE